MILPKHLIMDNGVVTGFINELQFQPAGFDLTLREVHRFKSTGRLDFDNSERRLSDTEALEFSNGELLLPKGAYKIIYNEYVQIPKNAAALCFPRSSLLRCGATLECAVWDPGYEGRSESLLVVQNRHGIILKKNAKIGQLIFVLLAEETKELYEGRYKGENK